jgi:hypothetical protein
MLRPPLLPCSFHKSPRIPQQLRNLAPARDCFSRVVSMLEGILVTLRGAWGHPAVHPAAAVRHRRRPTPAPAPCPRSENQKAFPQLVAVPIWAANPSLRPLMGRFFWQRPTAAAFATTRTVGRTPSLRNYVCDGRSMSAQTCRDGLLASRRISRYQGKS